MRVTLMFIALFLIFTHVAAAQSNCDALLRLGVPNIDIIESDYEKQTAFINKLKTYRSYEEAKRSSFGLFFSIDGLLDDFGLTHNDAGYTRLIEQLESLQSQT